MLRAKQRVVVATRSPTRAPLATLSSRVDAPDTTRRNPKVREKAGVSQRAHTPLPQVSNMAKHIVRTTKTPTTAQAPLNTTHLHLDPTRDLLAVTTSTYRPLTSDAQPHTAIRDLNYQVLQATTASVLHVTRTPIVCITIPTLPSRHPPSLPR